MKGKIISGLTPQQKIVAVNNKFGNTNISSQQGTTRVLFDSLPLDGRTEFRFYENAASRQYPLTNLGAEGNRLNVGETFVVQKVYYGVLELDADTGAFSNFQGISGQPITGAFYGEWSFLIANSQVIKQLPIVQTNNRDFNVTTTNGRDEAFATFTDIVIPPLLEYVLQYRSTKYTPETNKFLVCFIEGTAGILAPQTTF
jgi:hypothetical protein